MGWLNAAEGEVYEGLSEEIAGQLQRVLLAQNDVILVASVLRAICQWLMTRPAPHFNCFFILPEPARRESGSTIIHTHRFGLNNGLSADLSMFSSR